MKHFAQEENKTGLTLHSLTKGDKDLKANSLAKTYLSVAYEQVHLCQYSENFGHRATSIS